MLITYLTLVILVAFMLAFNFIMNHEEIELLIALSPQICIAAYLIMLLFAPITFILIIYNTFFNQEL